MRDMSIFLTTAIILLCISALKHKVINLKCIQLKKKDRKVLLFSKMSAEIRHPPRAVPWSASPLSRARLFYESA
jgi:hypothetical protein